MKIKRYSSFKVQKILRGLIVAFECFEWSHCSYVALNFQYLNIVRLNCHHLYHIEKRDASISLKFKEEGYASCNCLQKKLFAWILQVVNDGGWVFWWALKTHRKDHVDIKVAIAKLPPPKEKIHANTWVYYKRAREKPNPKLGKSSILIAWRGSEKLLSFFSL